MAPSLLHGGEEHIGEAGVDENLPEFGTGTRCPFPKILGIGCTGILEGVKPVHSGWNLSGEQFGKVGFEIVPTGGRMVVFDALQHQINQRKLGGA